MIVNTCGVPTHNGGPVVSGVTVMVATIGTSPRFTAAKTPMFPVPLPASPIPGALLVQLYVVPATDPLNVMAVVFAPLQTV